MGHALGGETNRTNRTKKYLSLCLYLKFKQGRYEECESKRQQYVLRRITPFTHRLCKFAANPRNLSAEGANECRSHEEERWAGH